MRRSLTASRSCPEQGVHTNGVENAWSLLNRTYHGTYDKMSTKHLNRYTARSLTAATTTVSFTLSRKRSAWSVA